MTPPEWAEVISAAAGTASVAVQAFLPWAAELSGRRRRRRPDAVGGAIPARRQPGSCVGTEATMVCYEPPDGGRLTVWKAASAGCGCCGREDGPW